MSWSIFYGDIHNHNAHGYGVGSIERSVDIARTHLDFFAFTGHSSWHDMVPMEGGREQHWARGFARLRETWPRVQRVIADANRDGAFCAFLGFEWHSSRFGDQCVVFPQDHRPIHYAHDLDALRAFCMEERALMIPHHLAYPSGHRGVDWDRFDECCTPVVEVFSEHGNAEDDRGPFTYHTHSMGGRETANTVRAALARGLRFGFVGSSDDHAGFPGAWGEGLMAALCEDLSRERILEAIRSRRVYALTGDRIEVAFSVDGAPMGACIEAGNAVEVAYRVSGRDELDVVEVIQDGLVVHRSFPSMSGVAAEALAQPVQLRLEWGWGPWGALALDRVTDWGFEVSLSGARLLRHFPCLQSMPFDEQRRHRFVAAADGHRLTVRSYTARQNAYRENPNQSVVLEVAGRADAILAIDMDAPVAMRTETTLGRLLDGSSHHFTGPFPKEAWQWHRVVPMAASALEDRVVLPVPTTRSHVYLRVRQKNGHMAWVSPVFINHR
ncbi:MAG: hypothetical protein AB7P21_07750 [Lautropia sp.]